MVWRPGGIITNVIIRRGSGRYLVENKDFPIYTNYIQVYYEKDMIEIGRSEYTGAVYYSDQFEIEGDIKKIAIQRKVVIMWPKDGMAFELYLDVVDQQTFFKATTVPMHKVDMRKFFGVLNERQQDKGTDRGRI